VPNAFTIVITVINGFAKVGSTEAAEKAEALLARMLQKVASERDDLKVNGKATKRGGRKSQSMIRAVRPDTVIFNACINCWATSRDSRSGHNALKLLKQMKELAAMEDEEGFDTVPDIVTYNTILSAWSHSGDKNAAPQAEKLVKSAIPPEMANTVTWNTVLHAWSQSKLPNAASRAEALLHFMIESKNPAIAPDAYSYSSVMDTIAKSKEPRKAARVLSWLEVSQDMYEKNRRPALRPTPVQFNTVLNACAFSALGTSSEERREALKIAVKTFSSMSMLSLSHSSRDAISRDTITYGNMLKCFANLMPPGDVRNRMALQIFQECCDEGLVGFLVWNEVRRAVPVKLLQEACQLKGQCGSLDVRDLPRSWSENNKMEAQQVQKQQHARNRSSQSIKDGTKRMNERKEGKAKQLNKAPPMKKVFLVEASFASDKDM
jgi:hypothetical protein